MEVQLNHSRKGWTVCVIGLRRKCTDTFGDYTSAARWAFERRDRLAMQGWADARLRILARETPSGELERCNIVE